jgi:selenide,water dikinase
MSELAQVLRHVMPSTDPNALVDSSTGDDAAVYLLDEDRALVVTTDFFTPIVDDPYQFGQIAAANALSDLYAMGARPLFALNLVAFPRKHLPDGALGEIVRGGAEKAAEAGIAILGGHSIDDPEPKYGLVAVGEVDPSRMTTNAGAKAGQHLVLTKPLGTGIIGTAIKAGKVSQGVPEGVMEAAIRSMATLNKAAAEAMDGLGIEAATDVTGFGLLGHLQQMLRASGCSARIAVTQVPFLPGALELAEAGHVPGGSKRNLTDIGDGVIFGPDIGEVHRLLLADAQTSGGLLISVPREILDDFLRKLEAGGSHGWVIGQTQSGPPGQIEVV